MLMAIFRSSCVSIAYHTTNFPLDVLMPSAHRQRSTSSRLSHRLWAFLAWRRLIQPTARAQRMTQSRGRPEPTRQPLPAAWQTHHTQHLFGAPLHLVSNAPPMHHAWGHMSDIGPPERPSIAPCLPASTHLQIILWRCATIALDIVRSVSCSPPSPIPELPPASSYHPHQHA